MYYFKKRARQALALLLSLMMCLSLMQVSVFALEGENEGSSDRPDVTQFEITVNCANEERGHKGFQTEQGGELAPICSKSFPLYDDTYILTEADDGAWTLDVDVQPYLDKFNSSAVYKHLPLEDTVSTTLRQTPDGTWSMDEALSVDVVCVSVTDTGNPDTQVGLLIKCLEYPDKHSLEWPVIDRSAFVLQGHSSPEVEVNNGTDEYPADKYPFCSSYSADLEKQISIVDRYYNPLVELSPFSDRLEHKHMASNDNDELTVTYYWDKDNSKWVLDGDSRITIYVEQAHAAVWVLAEDGILLKEFNTLQEGINYAKQNEAATTVQLWKNVTENVTITDDTVILDLNGRTVKGTGNGTVVTIKGGDVTLTGNGTITGGAGKQGGGVYIQDQGAFTMENGTITGNNVTEQGGGVFVHNGTFTMNNGTITGNTASYTGGGVFVYNYLETQTAQFVMNGGTISENTANAGGGIGAYGWKQDEGELVLRLNDGVIEHNTANGDGGGVAVESADAPDYVVNYGATGQHTAEIGAVTVQNNSANKGGGVYSAESIIKISGADITDNTADGIHGFGGGVYTQAGSVTVEDSKITGNTAKVGGGIFAGHKARPTEVVVSGSELYGNTGTSHSADVYGNSEGSTTTITLSDAASMNGTLNGKPITGWYWDENPRWGAAYTNRDDKVTAVTGTQCLIAAHDAYFTVTYTDGVENEVLFEDQTTELENGSATPAFNGTPTREGYTFAGWDVEVAETVTADVTYTAQWTTVPVTFTVTYTDGVDGQEIFADQTYTVNAGTATPAFSGTPARDGYEFAGWDPAVADAVTGNVTYTAQWTARSTGGGGTGGGGGGSSRPVTPTPPPTTITDPDVPLAAAPGLNSDDHYAYVTGYPDGTVRPQANITRAEVATIFFRLMTDEYRTTNWATANAFPDVADASLWYNNAVSTAAKAGLLKGKEDGKFYPTANITRAEFATIAARFTSDTEITAKPFPDTVGHWAEQDIIRAVQAGWIKGNSDGTFRPNDPITRAEAMTLVNRMLDRVPDKDHMLSDMVTWPDNPISAWYYEAVQEATNSHDYQRDELGVTETWTGKLPDRDWSALEKEWSNAASSSGGDVAGDLQK